MKKVFTLLVLTMLMASCGGGGGGATTYSIGGTVAGLGTGLNLVLQNNAGDDLSISADGSFVFATKLAKDAAYAVTVLTQPVGQTCTVANGEGTVGSADITDVAVTCAANTWFSGYFSAVYVPVSTGGVAGATFVDDGAGTATATVGDSSIVIVYGSVNAPYDTCTSATLRIDGEDRPCDSCAITTSATDIVGAVLTKCPVDEGDLNITISKAPIGTGALSGDYLAVGNDATFAMTEDAAKGQATAVNDERANPASIVITYSTDYALCNAVATNLNSSTNQCTACEIMDAAGEEIVLTCGEGEVTLRKKNAQELSGNYNIVYDFTTYLDNVTVAAIPYVAVMTDDGYGTATNAGATLTISYASNYASCTAVANGSACTACAISAGRDVQLTCPVGGVSTVLYMSRSPLGDGSLTGTFDITSGGSLGTIALAEVVNSGYTAGNFGGTSLYFYYSTGYANCSLIAGHIQEDVLVYDNCKNCEIDGTTMTVTCDMGGGGTDTFLTFTKQ